MQIPLKIITALAPTLGTMTVTDAVACRYLPRRSASPIGLGPARPTHAAYRQTTCDPMYPAPPVTSHVIRAP